MRHVFIMLVYLIGDRKFLNKGLVNGCTWSLEVDTPVHDFGIYTHTIWGPSNYYYTNVIMNITCILINKGLVNGSIWSLEVNTPVHDLYTHTIWAPSNYYYANVIMNITRAFNVIRTYILYIQTTIILKLIVHI